MYYNFYCNEKTLLDNYQQYNEGNRLLKRLLAQSGLPPDVCADLYLQKMDNKNGLSYDRYDLVKSFESRCKGKDELIKKDKILVYKQDIDFIKENAKEHKLTQQEMMVLFGVIQMCRILETDTLDLTTKFKIQQFCSCFSSMISYKRIESGNWFDVYHAPIGLDKICDKYGILIRVPCENGIGQVGCRYVYPNYELIDKTCVYEQVVTPRTNKLNLDYIFRQLNLDRIKFCDRCGKEFKAKSCHSKYCSDCTKKIRRIQTKLRVRKHRKKIKNVTQ